MGAFRLSELTGQTIPVVIWIFFLINTTQPGQLTVYITGTKEMRPLGKSLFHRQNDWSAMVQLPASSDFWKAL